MKRFLKDYLEWNLLILVPLSIIFGLAYLLGVKTDNEDARVIAKACFFITAFFTIVLPFIDGTLKNYKE